MSADLPMRSQVVCAVRGWFLGVALVMALPALAEPTAAPALDRALQAEFDAAGTAMHDVLAHRAQGDVAGTAAAEKALQNHRARFLDLQRDLERRSGASAVPPAVARERSPFVPDASILGEMSRLASERAVASEPQGRGAARVAARWDLYARSEAQQLMPEAAHAPHAMWGMYGTVSSEWPAPTREPPAATVEPAVAQAAAAEEVAREPPREPFFVYRDPHGGRTDSRNSRQPP